MSKVTTEEYSALSPKVSVILGWPQGHGGRSTDRPSDRHGRESSTIKNSLKRVNLEAII